MGTTKVKLWRTPLNREADRVLITRWSGERLQGRTSIIYNLRLRGVEIDPAQLGGRREHRANRAMCGLAALTPAQVMALPLHPNACTGPAVCNRLILQLTGHMAPWWECWKGEMARVGCEELVRLRALLWAILRREVGDIAPYENGVFACSRWDAPRVKLGRRTLKRLNAAMSKMLVAYEVGEAVETYSAADFLNEWQMTRDGTSARMFHALQEVQRVEADRGMCDTREEFDACDIRLREAEAEIVAAAAACRKV